MSMRAHLRHLLAVALLAAGIALPAQAAAGELQPFSATYSLTYRGTHAATIEVQLEKLSDSRWSYRARTSARFLARLLAGTKLPAEAQHSVFRIQDGRLVPESFTAEDRNNSKDQSIAFDWAAGRVRGMVERKAVDLPTRPGLLDELSVQVALMQALLAGRTPEHFVMLDEDRIKDYLYTTEGRERLKTEVGEYDTVIFRSSRPDSPKGTWFWCAPELGYLPLKVERRDGKEVQLTMRMEKVTR